jgi:CRP-like cAMP-binding protein
MITESLLLQWGAGEKKYEKGEYLFSEGDQVMYYFQVKTGKIKMFNLNEDGKLFIQGIFEKGDSFGEPPIFADSPFPAGAVAEENSVVYRLNRNLFIDLLKANPEIHLQFTHVLAERLLYKSMQLREISGFNPEHRILSLFRYLKKEQQSYGDTKFEIKLTRQDIADLTGLRVETIIRAVKTLEKQKSIEIINHKIYY